MTDLAYLHYRAKHQPRRGARRFATTQRLAFGHGDKRGSGRIRSGWRKAWANGGREMIRTAIHVREGAEVPEAEVIHEHGSRDRGHYVRQQIRPRPEAYGEGVTLFLSPQQAIELGRALVAAGTKAQQADDVEAATLAALEKSS